MWAGVTENDGVGAERGAGARGEVTKWELQN